MPPCSPPNNIIRFIYYTGRSFLGISFRVLNLYLDQDKLYFYLLIITKSFSTQGAITSSIYNCNK